jgi:hypothetical protein
LFDADRYFDVFVEYAKAAPDEILMLVTVHNRGPDAAEAHAAAAIVVSQHVVVDSERARPKFSADHGGVKIEHANSAISASTAMAIRICFFATTRPTCAGFQPAGRAKGFFKDAFHEYIIAGNKSAVNPAQTGTKAGALYELNVPAGQSVDVRLRLSSRTPRRPANRGMISTRFFPAAKRGG